MNEPEGKPGWTIESVRAHPVLGKMAWSDESIRDILDSGAASELLDELAEPMPEGFTDGMFDDPIDEEPDAGEDDPRLGDPALE